MSCRLLATTLGALLIAQVAHGEIITLTDGTRIHAEVLSLHDGVYTIRSGTLGIMEVARSEVVRVEHGNPEAGPSVHGYDALKADLLGNPDAMKAIMALQDDPQVRELLEDPETLGAIQSLDLDALSNDPRILEFMQRPEVRDIGDLVR